MGDDGRWRWNLRVGIETSSRFDIVFDGAAEALLDVAAWRGRDAGPCRCAGARQAADRRQGLALGSPPSHMVALVASSAM